MAEDAGVAHEPEAPAELSYVIGALNGELDKEFAVAERLTTKSRQVFALAGAFCRRRQHDLDRAGAQKSPASQGFREVPLRGFEPRFPP